MQELEVIKFELDFEKTYPYVREILEHKYILSKWVLENIDLKQGRFFTYICDSTDVEKIYHFNSGIIFPPPDRKGGFSLKHSLSYYVFEFISEKIINKKIDLCALEEIMRSLANPSVKEVYELGALKTVEENIIYFLCEKNFSEELFVKTLRMADAIWHCVGIAAQWKNKDLLIGSAFPVENIDTEGDIVLIIGAYDKESYIIWEKFK